MFGVFWGIFMLMIMLGSGRGLENGVLDSFNGMAKNGIYVWTQKTTMAYSGMLPGRYIRMNNSDMAAIKNEVPQIEVLCPRNQLGGWRGGNNVSRNNKTGAFSIYGDYPEILMIDNMKVPKGRFINEPDIVEKRKVAVIGEKAVSTLFDSGERVLGGYILIKGVYFQVVGVFKSVKKGGDAEREQNSIFVPFTTFQNTFNFGNDVSWFCLTPKAGIKAEQAENAVKSVLMARHKIHPQDFNALGSWNTEKEFKQISGLFTGIGTFVWVVGLGTLLAGIIGVSNIMLIVVKERTKEIGIRKSLGATPWSIVSLILQESVVITFIAGYLGLVMGIGIIEILNLVLEDSEGGMFSRPEINLSVAFSCLVVIVLGGLAAGFIPARKAASIEPVEALRYE